MITATDLGIVDARNDLVACFLREHPLERINAAEIPRIVGDRNDLREEIVAAARGGSDRALTALLWAAVDGDEWCPLEELATRLCEQYTAVETLTLVEVEGKSFLTQSESANFATGGLRPVTQPAPPDRPLFNECWPSPAIPRKASGTAGVPSPGCSTLLADWRTPSDQSCGLSRCRSLAAISHRCPPSQICCRTSKCDPMPTLSYRRQR